MATELEKAKAAYTSASGPQRKVLEDVFGKSAFAPKITDQVKTFEDACSVLGVDAKKIVPYTKATTPDQKALNAAAKLFLIARALNQGWKPDWNNSNEYKYYPYFKMKTGFGFSGTYSDYDYAYTPVGSRLCFKTRDLARYAATQFEELYKDYFLIG